MWRNVWENVLRLSTVLSLAQVYMCYMQYWVEGVCWCVVLRVSLLCISLVYKFRGFEATSCVVNTTLSLSTSVQSVNK